MNSFIPMPHNVTVIRSGEQLDDWGYPVESDIAEEFRGRVIYNTRRETITVANGEEIVYSAEVLMPVTELAYADRIRVSAGGLEETKSPIEIQVKHDFSGKPVMLKVVI